MGTSRIFKLLGTALLAVTLPLAIEAKAADRSACKAPAEFTHFETPLPALKQTIAKRQNVHIVALGSSSTAGTGASSKDKRYPQQLAHALRKALPQINLRVTNHGKGGTLASHMLKRLKKRILPQKPTLVIWQTGVNDAIRKVPLNKFRDILRDGIMLMQKRGIDVVLIDQQFFPGAKRYAKYDAYISAMANIAEEQQIPLLRRYALMKHLVASAQYDVGDLLAKDRFHLNDASYACLGHVLGKALVHAVK